MYPMDFEEFLWAKKDNITMSVIRDAFTRKKPLGDPIHRKIMQIFRTYIAVGGMPQAVQAFVDGKSYQEIDFIKRSILSLYDNDLRKYDNDTHEKASVIFKTFGKLGINQGMILENMAAQMLKANGYDLFFHEFMYRDKEAAKEKKYEIDFLFVKKKKICPIEVKSSSYKNHKSFDLFLQKYQLKTEDKFILYTKDFKEDGIMYLPLYMTICL